MNMKLVALLIAVVIALLGIVIALSGKKADQPQPQPVATVSPAPPPVVRPRDNSRDGSFKKAKPSTYGYETPK